MTLSQMLMTSCVVLSCVGVAHAQSETTPMTPVEALAPYYAQLEYDVPRAPQGPALPGIDQVLTRIAVGSCSTSDREIPILHTVLEQSPDLFMYIGDNVYGDARRYEASLPELRQAYHRLAERPAFQALSQSVPMLTTWDDHDYGMNDLGREFPFKGFAEQLFLDFWNVPAEDERRQREGIYTSQSFGPEGQRVQIILLDTRYFRSDLTPTDERGAPGKERYIQSTAEDQDMLGAAQWAWLEEELQKPADVRLIVSSIQVHADGHGWEAWRTLPQERQRLYDLIGETEAKGVVFVSGDRHSSGLYVREDLVDYPLYEITTSSLNLSYSGENNEPGPHRIGDMYTPENFGLLNFDWDAQTLGLEIRNGEDEIVRNIEIDLNEIRG